MICNEKMPGLVVNFIGEIYKLMKWNISFNEVL